MEPGGLVAPKVGYANEVRHAQDEELIRLFAAIGSTEVGVVRERIGQAAVSAGLGIERLEDVRLATSELVANAFEHGSHAQAALVRAEEHVEVRVINTATPGTVPPPSEWKLPGPLSITGRGLAVVGAVADETSVIWDHDRVTISALFYL